MGKHQCKGTLYASACSNRTSIWSPVASSSGTHSYLWGNYTLVSSSVPVCLCNLNTCAIDVPAKIIIGQIVLANWVPLVVHPTRTAAETKYPAQKGWVLEALDLQGLKSGLSQSRNRPGSCCSNGSICLHTLTQIWAKLLWPSTK